ncbi:MAG: formylglycine-generating enzyme family protein [bacterium]
MAPPDASAVLPEGPWWHPGRAETPSRPALLLIPAGAFLMGSAAGQRAHASDERLHRVEISQPFLAAATEITQAQWQAVMGTSPSFYSGCDRCPVERVNWYEAVAFTLALSAREGRTACYTTQGCSGVVGAGCGRPEARRHWCMGDYRCQQVERVPGCTGYRLPTEAEWERAARAGLDPSAQEEPPAARRARLGGAAWYAETSLIDRAGELNCTISGLAGRCGTHPVASLRPNDWGLFDTLGNVAEWCEDAYDAEYPAGPVVVDPVGSGSGPLKVTRGGSWFTSLAWVRPGLRDPAMPLRRANGLGLRVVRSPRGSDGM